MRNFLLLALLNLVYLGLLWITWPTCTDTAVAPFGLGVLQTLLVVTYLRWT